KRRNYQQYREASIIDLQTILRETMQGKPHLYNHFFKQEDPPSSSSTHCAEDNDSEQDDESDDAGTDIPVNCPVRTPDEALVPIHGAFYFHIRSKINLGKKILKKEQAKNILDAQCLHYSRACKVGLVNYSIQDDHFHMLIAVSTDSYAVARERASKII